MTQDVNVKLIQDFHGKSCIEQEECSVHRQIALKLKEETVNYLVYVVL
jgi:hypothetical protein